ncbi:MAG: CIS tube protein [Gammaproteobacteria bacterium]
MALMHLTIQVETKGGKLVFNASDSIVAQFNPNRLAFSRSASWQSQDAKRDTPELQFTGAEPRTLKIDLFFDTYDSPDSRKEDVRKQTDKFYSLTTVETHGDKHRPPVCRLLWGSMKLFFQGVLQSLEQQFTLFMADGTPVRATLNCTFKEWRTNYEDLNRQNQQSPDVAKMWIVKRGETLHGIAALEYRNPALWRPIAMENDIDDPINLIPGSVLLIPTLGDRELH